MSVTLMMKAAQTSETMINHTSLHGAATQKTAIFNMLVFFWEGKLILFISI
jgi:hypothetical protein